MGAADGAERPAAPARPVRVGGAQRGSEGSGGCGRWRLGSEAQPWSWRRAMRAGSRGRDRRGSFPRLLPSDLAPGPVLMQIESESFPA